MSNRIVTIGLGATGIAAFICLAAPHAARANQEAEETFQEIDTNSDGKISSDEFAAAHKAKFEKMDTDHDGKLTAEEMTAAHEKHQKMGGKTDDKTKAMVIERIKIMDTNGDGVITEEEFVTDSKARFGKMDTDHDGYLTKAELKAGRQKAMEKAQKTE
jgi:Ca2+-binding EF-hand superfamily protein